MRTTAFTLLSSPIGRAAKLASGGSDVRRPQRSVAQRRARREPRTTLVAVQQIERHGGLGALEGGAPGAVPRYYVRLARPDELYIVSDVRASSFYEFPIDQYFYPVRRREMYLKLRNRLDTPGTFSYVVVDTQPAEDWKPYAVPPGSGELVVASADASLYDHSGARTSPPSIDDRDRLYISSMAVREEFRGLGLGRLLLEDILDRAIGLGVRQVFLHVDPDNVPAATLYESLAFEKASLDGKPPKWLELLAKEEHVLLRKRMGTMSAFN